jgi:hypothetical protein
LGESNHVSENVFEIGDPARFEEWTAVPRVKVLPERFEIVAHWREGWI